MKLVQVDGIPEKGYFVVTGISNFQETPFPFGESFYADGNGRIFEYENEYDTWEHDITDSLYFEGWSDVKYFVIEE
ncbi:hypothetical protein ASswx1_102 [Aeromonas phage Asswx_1]|uniref:Uncharacterized protein n=1 Tax=Aeromonas phage Asswx_1 TaxID=2419739 RepID=A0A411B859_9CAUD|nr:hypothetical protein ASswx1_102 [Aeromonas phage Asswx_1]